MKRTEGDTNILVPKCNAHECLNLLSVAQDWVEVVGRCNDTYKLATDAEAPEVMRRLRKAIADCMTPEVLP